MRVPQSLLVLAILSGVLAAEEPFPEKPDAAALVARLEAMEKRIQSLEQAMVEKDARIAELQKKLAAADHAPVAQGNPPAHPPAGPNIRPPAPPVPNAPQDLLNGFQMNLTPEQARELMRRMDEHFRREFEEGGDDPWAFRNQRPGLPDPDELDPFELPRRPAAPPQKPRLGVFLDEVTAQLNTLHKNTAEEGAFITRIVPESPADKAGLVAGDCITSFNGRKVRTPQEFTVLIAAAPEGKNQVTVLRRGEPMNVEVQLGKAPPALPQQGRPARPPVRQDGGWLREGGNARREVTEVKSGALDLPAELAKEMQLGEKTRAKLAEAMAAHAKKLADEYLAKTEQRRQEGRRALNDQDLQAMAESHALEIEKELKDVLSEAQLESWRKYRARHGHEISIFRRVEEERGAEGGEALNF